MPPLTKDDPVNPFAGVDDRELISSILERFESARERDGRANLSEFALPENHPSYVPTLIELIRSDRTWHRKRGVEKSLDAYRQDFPSLFANPEAARALAITELPSGPGNAQKSSAEERSDASLWHPTAGRLVSVDEAAPSLFRVDDPAISPAVDSGADSPFRDAAALYRRFRESGAGAEARSTLFAEAGREAKSADLFFDIHLSSPELADRLSRGTLAMPAAGDEFLNFRLVDEIGRGAFGRVFLARQTDLAGRQVVLKITAELPGESQTLAQLQHTNIVPIYSAHAREPFHALCMPFFGTTTLADVGDGLAHGRPIPLSGKHLVTTLDERKRTYREQIGADTVRLRSGPTPPREADSTLQTLESLSYVDAVLWIGARLAEGLEHAHRRGILHRDLKPANVLLTDEGQPMLLDFNLSEDTKLRSTAAARAGGTLPYMSPEQLEAFRDGRPLDARSDVYSLGLVLFELLTGRHAFPLRHGPTDEFVAQTLQDRERIRPRLRAHNARVSPAAESIVLHCLEPDPTRRYQSARELREDVDRHLADLPLRHAPEPSLRERAAKWRRRHPRLTSSTSVAVLCGAVLLALVVLSAGRLEAARRLEARETLAGFREQVREARYLLDKAAPGRKRLEEGVALSDAALGRYRVLEGGFREDQSAVSDLSGEDRQALRDEVHDVLLMRARATALLADQDQDPTRRRETAEAGLRDLDLARGTGAGPSKAALLQSADLNQFLGREPEALRLRKEADGLPPRTAGDLYLLAMRLGDRHDFARALPMLREATVRDPRDMWAWFYQAYCHQELGEYPDAVRCYTVAIALWPRGAIAWMPLKNRGQALARMGHYEQACADFDEAIRQRPGEAETFLNRGIARLEWQKYAPAIADFDETLRLDPSASRAYFLRARARELSGDEQGARRDFEQGLQEKPSDEFGWIDRALARVKTDPAGALADLDHALELNPRSLLALQNKAHVLGDRLGRQEDAVAVLDREVELYPVFVRGRIGRGVHLARLGRRTQALADVRAALALNTHPETLYQAADVYSLTSREHPEDASEAFPLLAVALRLGFGLEYVDGDADFEPVRDHPEFKRIVKAAREAAAAEKGER
jgi:serine/threonine protein kinase/Tfp pilus assembly protein PilF